MRGVFEKLGLDPEEETPGRQVVRHIGESLVQAMEMAVKAGDAGRRADRRRASAWSWPRPRTISTGS